jgi:hypothetical protein
MAIVPASKYALGGNGSNSPTPNYLGSEIDQLTKPNTDLHRAVVRIDGESAKQIWVILGTLASNGQNVAILPCPDYCNSGAAFVDAATDPEIQSLL